MKTESITSRINFVITGLALMVLSVKTLAVPIEKTLEFTCPFPFIGDRIISATIAADYPEGVDVPVDGSSVVIEPVFVDAITVVPEMARLGLDFAGATTITGEAYSISTFHTSAGPLVHNIDLILEPTEVPEDETGPFDVAASGYSPAQSFDLSHVGTAALTIDSLILDLKNVRADGSVATTPVGEFVIDCALVADQDNILTNIQVTTSLLEAAVYVDSSEINFGRHLLGQTSIETLTLRNVGGAVLGVNAIGIAGRDAAEFSQTNNCTVVNAGESCEVIVSYTASNVMNHQATLLIESTDEDESLIVVDLIGSGYIDVDPDINIAISSLDFGTIDEGETKTEAVLIENLGTAELVLSSVSVNNMQGTEFSVTENCSIIPAGASCSEVVSYNAIEGLSSGLLTVSSNDNDEASLEVSLAGNGKAVILEDLIIPVTLNVEGSTFIAANDSTVSLTGLIQSQFNLTQGTFTGDLMLAPTEGSFSIVQGWKRYQATAKIEFEPVGETVGTLIDGVLVATSQAYVKLPKVTKTLFGLVNWQIGGGSSCRTKEPVAFQIRSIDGEYFDALSGGVVKGEYAMTGLEDCGLLTGILSSKLAGSGNTINLTLTPDL